MTRIPLVPNPKNLPSPEQGQATSIRPGSSLAVVGLFVELIRKRFPASAELPWEWNADIKKAGGRAIAVESAFNEDKTHHNFRTAIYVDRDEQIIGRTVIGDFAGQSLTSSLRGFWALESVPILIECVASKKAESAIIADLVGLYLHASSDLIQAKFGLHDMTPVSRGRTQPFPRDKDQWVTPLSFTVQYSLRWTNRPTATILQDIELEVRAANPTDATQYFETIALYSSTPDPDEV